MKPEQEQQEDSLLDSLNGNFEHCDEGVRWFEFLDKWCRATHGTSLHYPYPSGATHPNKLELGCLCANRLLKMVERTWLDFKLIWPIHGVPNK